MTGASGLPPVVESVGSNPELSKILGCWNEVSTSSQRRNKKQQRSDNTRMVTRTAFLTKAIEFIQRQRVPSFLLIRNGSDDDHKEGTPIIGGIDQVLFGTQPACEVVTVCGMYPPRYLCYMVSGSTCDIIQFFIDLALHQVFHLEGASLCWVLGFSLSIVFRHTTHRYLVFGDYVGGYRASLLRMYAGYSVTIVLSTFFNFIMTHYIHLQHYVAWIITLLWTGIVNYFILKKLWSFGGNASTVSTVRKMPQPDRQVAVALP